jgi:uncharacterized membrane protein SirB2
MKSKILYTLQIIAGLALALYFNPFSFNLQAGILSMVICVVLVYIGIYGLQKRLVFRQLPRWMQFAIAGAWLTVAAYVGIIAFYAILFRNFTF